MLDHLAVVLTLAHVLQRLEGSREPVGAEQYRSVVAHLTEEMRQVPPSAEFQALLEAYPAAAELYENLNYGHAGLCRSPLELALGAELRARQLIQRVSRRSAQ
jgi:hypothetical protein